MKKTINLDGTLIEYQIHDQHEDGVHAPWLVCLPGLGCDLDLFKPLRPNLVKKFRLIEINHRGIGASSLATSEFSISDLADDVLKITDALAISTFSLLGISMGGFITQEILLKKNEGIKAAAILCSTGGGDQYFTFPFIKDEDIVKLYAIEKNVRAELSTATTTHPELKQCSPRIFEEIVSYRENLEVPIETVLKQNHAAIDFMKKGVKLESIDLPIFVGHGENDRFVPVANAELLSRDLKAVEFKTYPKSDHFFFWEKGEGLSQDLSDFFMEYAK
jgi:3-oxoadipate enol-lactonase